MDSEAKDEGQDSASFFSHFSRNTAAEKMTIDVLSRNEDYILAADDMPKRLRRTDSISDCALTGPKRKRLRRTDSVSDCAFTSPRPRKLQRTKINPKVAKDADVPVDTSFYHVPIGPAKCASHLHGQSSQLSREHMLATSLSSLHISLALIQ